MTDKPPCPRCGHEDSKEELERVDALLKKMEAEMLKD